MFFSPGSLIEMSRGASRANDTNCQWNSDVQKQETNAFLNENLYGNQLWSFQGSRSQKLMLFSSGTLMQMSRGGSRAPEARINAFRNKNLKNSTLRLRNIKILMGNHHF